MDPEWETPGAQPGSTVAVFPRLRASYPTPNGHSKLEELVIRRWLVALVLTCAAAQVTQAQIIRPVLHNTPAAWTALSIGWLTQGGFCDAGTNACYDFG